MPQAKEELAFRPPSSRSGRKWVVLLVTSALLITLFAAGIFFSSARQTGPDFQDPELVSSVFKDFAFLDDPSLWGRIKNQLFRLYSKNIVMSPKGITFLPSPARDCEVLELVNSAHQISRMRYHVERSIAKGTVFFGITNQVNGLEWIAAIEGAISTGKVSWLKDSIQRTNAVVLEFDRWNRLILSPEKAQEYQNRFPKLKLLLPAKNTKR